MTADVFILTYDYQDVYRKNVLYFHGLSSEGQPVEVIIDSNKPVFFIDRSVSESQITPRHTRRSLEIKTFQDNPVDAVYFNTQRDLKTAADELHKKGILTYESDISPAKRFLMERFINVQMEVTGEAAVKGSLYTFTNPRIKPCEFEPAFKVLSLDIETGENNTTLYSVAVHLTGPSGDEKKVFMLGDMKSGSPEYISLCTTERDLLRSFMDWFYKADPDIIIGWHVIGFDLMFLEKKSRSLSIPLNLSRGTGKMSLGSGRMGNFYAYIPGRVVIDGPPALRRAFYSFEDFRLETVAQDLLGTGKTIAPGQNKVKEIEHLFKEDKEKLAEYNLQDCVLVTDIFRKTGLIDMSVKRAQLSGLIMDELGMMTAAFDHFYLPRLHREGYVAPDIKDIDITTQAPGGYVIDPKPGIYENVVLLDFKSLYPTIIRTFKIGPLSLLLADRNPVITPGGYRFSKDKHFLADFIGELMERRSEAKKSGNKYLSHAIKILMNSFYGVMGSYGCRFYHTGLASAITKTGHWLLLGSRSFFENNGYEVVYGDTDSLFVKLKDYENMEAGSVGESLALQLNKYWSERILQEYNVESYLEIEYEKFYRKFIITPARGGDYGAKKRYAGLVEQNGRTELEFVGMEFVRSDWTKLAKNFQEELYRRVFANEEIFDWIREYINRIKKGEFNSQMVYRKRLRKDAEDYVKNVPPHVKAARMINQMSGTINYVITKRGPVPLELEHSDIDFQHYIERQIKPISDSLLSLLGKSFDSLFESGQLSFFDT